MVQLSARADLNIFSPIAIAGRNLLIDEIEIDRSFATAV